MSQDWIKEAERMNHIIDKYKLKQQIAKGAFSIVYSMEKIQDNSEQIAIKIENKQFKMLYLDKEVKILLKTQKIEGFPKVLFYKQTEKYNIMGMQLLGSNLETLKNNSGGKFSLKTTLMLADQMINRKEGYIHLDIKPQNFVMGSKPTLKDRLYLIDFGCCKFYQTKHSFTYSFNGTPIFSSINAYLGLQLGCRDDLESIGYTLIYLFKGQLPWQGIIKLQQQTQQRAQEIQKIKQNTSLDQLCEGLPTQFYTYMSYTKNLEFDQKPNYAYLRKIFAQLFVQCGYIYDYQYCWKNHNNNYHQQNNFQKSTSLENMIKKPEQNTIETNIQTNKHSITKPQFNSDGFLYDISESTQYLIQVNSKLQRQSEFQQNNQIVPSKQQKNIEKHETNETIFEEIDAEENDINIVKIFQTRKKLFILCFNMFNKYLYRQLTI